MVEFRTAVGRSHAVELVGFSLSPLSQKKYRAYLSDGSHVDFGDVRYQQYRDSTPIHAAKLRMMRAYSSMDHLDEERRKRYFKRHKKNYPKYSADWFHYVASVHWFSKNYLW